MLRPTRKPCSLEKGAPFVVEQCAVGLQIVLDALAGLLVLLFQFDDFVEELEPEQRRFAALPGEDDFVAVLAFDVLADVGLEDLVGDLELALAAQQLLLVQVIAIRAVHVADRSDGLHHRVIGAAGSLRPWIGREVGDLEAVAHEWGYLSSILRFPNGEFGVVWPPPPMS